MSTWLHGMDNDLDSIAGSHQELLNRALSQANPSGLPMNIPAPAHRVAFELCWSGPLRANSERLFGMIASQAALRSLQLSHSCTNRIFTLVRETSTDFITVTSKHRRHQRDRRARVLAHRQAQQPGVPIRPTGSTMRFAETFRVDVAGSMTAGKRSHSLLAATLASRDNAPILKSTMSVPPQQTYRGSPNTAEHSDSAPRQPRVTGGGHLACR